MHIHIKRKRFAAVGDAPPRPIFEGFDLTLEQGELCAILGPSGTGKTTLLNIVAGLDNDFTGAVAGRGEPVGYLFQNMRLLPWLTAAGNLEIVLKGERAAALHWLDTVGLADAADVYPARLSVGMARRVALARALAVRPGLLLLDEPFTALDERTAALMRDLLLGQLAELRPTTVLVTHDPVEAAQLASRVITLGGTPVRIHSDERLPAAGAVQRASPLQALASNQ